MSFLYILLFFVLLNISGYFVIRHFGKKQKESPLFINIAVLSCVLWIVAIALTTYIYYVSGYKILVYVWGASIILGFASTITVLLMKLVGYYRK